MVCNTIHSLKQPFKLEFYIYNDFVPTKSMLAKINPNFPELNTLPILSG